MRNKQLEKATRKERIKRRNYNERRKAAKRNSKELTEGDKNIMAAIILGGALIIAPIFKDIGNKINDDNILSDDILEENKNDID